MFPKNISEYKMKKRNTRNFKVYFTKTKRYQKSAIPYIVKLMNEEEETRKIILANVKGRGCYKTKIKESSKQLRTRSITKAQLKKQQLTFIRTNTTEAEWETLKKDGVYETELGDIAIIAVARAIHMDILIFNTNAEVSISPIETVNADEYEGGYRININPIIQWLALRVT